MKKYSKDNEKDISEIGTEALGVLSAYDWPGNVRELRNCVERMVVFARGNILTLTDVPAEIRSAVGEQFESKPQDKIAAPGKLDLDVKENERNLVIKALEECGGNRTKAAKLLNMSRRTLHRKLHEYDLT